MLLNQWQTNFTSGEISEPLYARTDLKQFTNSARSIKNFIVRPQGGLFKRPGTAYVTEVKDSTKTTRLIPFKYSIEQAYVLEMGEGYFRFYKDGGQILSTAAITNGTFATDLTGWTDEDTGTGASTFSSGVMRLNGGATGVAIRTQAIDNVGTMEYTLTFTVSTNSCTYRLGTTSGGTEITSGTGTVGTNTVTFTLSSAGTIYLQFRNANNNNSDIDNVSLSTPIYQIDNPYAEDELDDVKFAQSYDKLYLVHPNHRPQEVTRTGHSAWTIDNLVLEDGPYYDVTDNTYGGVGADFTISSSASAVGAATITSTQDLFVSTDVGRFLRYQDGTANEWGWAEITGYTDSKHVSVTIKKAFAGSAATKQWRLGSFSDTTGWPATVAIHDQRLVFGRTDKQQQGIWFSKAGDLMVFQPDNSAYKDEVDSDTAMTYTISGASVILWLVSAKSLYVGTSGSLYLAQASNAGELLTPDNIQIKPVAEEPSAAYSPVVAGSTILYPDYFGRRLTEVRYSFSEDSFQTQDLAILSQNRTKGKIKWLSRQNAPNYLIWGSTEDGKLFAVTYIKDQNVLAWTEQVLGGDDVAVKAIATIPGPSEDQTWFIVSRTIDGSTVQYVEYLTEMYLDQDVTVSNYLDCSASYSGSATTTISGLNYLEGQEVAAFSTAGYSVGSGLTVTSGAISTTTSVTGAVVGLPYTSSIKTNQLNVESGAGPSSGKIGRTHSVVLRLYNSYGGKIGVSSSVVDTIPELSSNTIMDSALVLFTGDRELQVPMDFSLNPVLYIEHSLPVPFNLLGIVSKFSLSGK